MKIYISYFYQIRNFPINLIPVSTAMYDPKWFNWNKRAYIDKRGVINGFRIRMLSPYKVEHVDCVDGCDKNYRNCRFLKEYRSQLDNTDFNEVMKVLKKFELSGIRNSRCSEVDLCLMVHEKSDNPCSERKVLVDWFREHGVEVVEFNIKS